MKPQDRRVLLVGLWTAALVVGGIFIPIAIGESALSVERWSDNGCKFFVGSSARLGRDTRWYLSEGRRRAMRRRRNWLAGVVGVGTYSLPEHRCLVVRYENPLAMAFEEVYGSSRQPTAERS